MKFDEFINEMTTFDLWVNLQSYKSKLIELQQAAITEILLLEPAQITRQLNRLTQVEERFNKFWDWYLSQLDCFDNGYFLMELEHFFIVRNSKKHIDLNLYHWVAEVASLKDGCLLSFADQVRQIMPEPVKEKQSEQPTIDNILNEMFTLTDYQMTVLKGNLQGKDQHMSLTYTGKKTDLWRHLSKLRAAGIERRIIAWVFSKYCRYKSSIIADHVELKYAEIYKKIENRG